MTIALAAEVLTEVIHVKIVIDIYKPLKEAIDIDAIPKENVAVARLLIKAVKNGQPLPAGHGRLIDEQDAIDALSVMFSGNDEILNDALECIEQLPEVVEADGGDI